MIADKKKNKGKAPVVVKPVIPKPEPKPPVVIPADIVGKQVKHKSFGIGMMYPRVYQEAVEDVKNGKYDPEWQEIMSSEEFVAVNAEREIYICSECKHWKSDLNLSLYRPKNVEAIRTKQYGIKTVEEWDYVPYVVGYDFKEDYSLIKVFVHKCKKCGTENTSNGMLMWD